MRSLSLPLALLLLAACSGASPRGPDAPDASDSGEPLPDFDPGVLQTDLVIDLASRTGRAVITHGPAETITLEVGDLSELRALDGSGTPVSAEVVDGRVTLPGRTDGPTTYAFEYVFSPRPSGTLQGWVPEDGFTFLWPYFCGNLFPCVSSPSDGMRSTLSVEGVPAGQTAIYPRAIEADAPSYMLAIAVGDYTHEPLGTTPAGTSISVYFFSGERDSAIEGVEHLVEVFDFYERTYGPYLFGDDVASVAAAWGPAGLGGMEHHPYFHVAQPSMASPVVQAHEAAHGWFGNGVRIRCWEDFVLSEGVTTYLAGRALGAVRGPAYEAEVWDGYATDLANAVSRGDTEAWPEGCDAIDILEHPVWSSIPYTKGAFFLRAVEREVGRDALDGVLSRFYQRYAGRDAASMSDLLAAIQTDTGFDPSALRDVWLRGRGLPPLP